MQPSELQNLEVIVGYVVCVIVGAFGLVLIVQMFRGKIKLETLLEDEDHTASTSRFQLIIFTFVVSLCFFLVVVSNVNIRQAGAPSKTTTSENDSDKSPLPEVPGGVLALLGISASSYLVSKGISNSNGNGTTPTKGTGNQGQANQGGVNQGAGNHGGAANQPGQQGNG
jgi:hypothetical protein